jgi:hypothetical protein
VGVAKIMEVNCLRKPCSCECDLERPQEVASQQRRSEIPFAPFTIA